jgi:hypothetical protein
VAVTGLDDDIEDDPAVRQQLQDYYDHVEEQKQAIRAQFPRDLGSKDERYLGERSCRSCHQQIWDTYAASPHKNAYNSLRTKNMEFEPECLVCHTTGYRYANGFENSGSIGHLANVECEACHGYGTLHSRDGSWLKRARESCNECHDLSNSPHADDGFEFDSATYWEKIKH